MRGVLRYYLRSRVHYRAASSDFSVLRMHRVRAIGLIQENEDANENRLIWKLSCYYNIFIC